MTIQKIIKATKYGYDARLNNVERTAILDSNLVDILDGVKDSKLGLAIIEAWNKAWTEADFNATC